MTWLLTFIEDLIFGTPSGELRHGGLHEALIMLRFYIATGLYLLIIWVIHLIKRKK